MTRLEFEHLHQPDGWLSPAFVEVGANGMIESVGADPTPDWTADERVRGFTVPGMPNLHSHGFQRALAGRTESRTADADADNLWSWRELMYRFVGRLDPDDLRAITAQVYLELVQGGFTSVAEFHYLHLDQGGRRYTEPATMALAVVEAARDVGIGLTVLPVLYRHAGVGRPPIAAQERFVLEVDEVLEIGARVDALDDPLVATGLAPHSLRAASIAEIRELIGDPRGQDRPIHIHIAERPEEVAEVSAALGAPPVRILAAEVGIGPRWCLVHATHIDESEMRDIAESGAVVGLCPTTEATVADGLFPLARFISSEGRWGVGTDSHYATDAALELRCLELGQRLADGRRNPIAEPTGLWSHSGRALFDRALAGGQQAVGQNVGVLRSGSRADVVVLDADHPTLIGHGPSTALDAWLLSGGTTSPVRDVMVGGRWVMRDGDHPSVRPIRERYRATVRRLFDGP